MFKICQGTREFGMQKAIEPAAAQLRKSQVLQPQEPRLAIKNYPISVKAQQGK